MEKIDYKNHLLQIVSMIKDKAAYLKNIEENSKTYDPKTYEGMATTYYLVLNDIKSHIESSSELKLSDFGLDDFDPEEILSYRPKS